MEILSLFAIFGITNSNTNCFPLVSFQYNLNQKFVFFDICFSLPASCLSSQNIIFKENKNTKYNIKVKHKRD